MHRRQQRAGILAAGSGRPLATSVMDVAELLEGTVNLTSPGQNEAS